VGFSSVVMVMKLFVLAMAIVSMLIPSVHTIALRASTAKKYDEVGTPLLPKSLNFALHFLLVVNFKFLEMEQRLSS
jgi:hypothetical protein